MNAQEQIAFGIAAGVFLAMFGIQVGWGKNVGRRFFFGGVMAVCTLYMVLVAMPDNPRTDVAKFADALGKSTEQRIAAKYQEMRNGILASPNRH
jgi:hypothetical protein